MLKRPGRGRATVPALLILVYLLVFGVLTVRAGFNVTYLGVMAIAGCGLSGLWYLANRNRPGRDPVLRPAFSVANTLALCLVVIAPLIAAEMTGLSGSPYAATYWQGATLMLLVSVAISVFTARRRGAKGDEAEG